jgi:hypothetical protein
VLKPEVRHNYIAITRKTRMRSTAADAKMRLPVRETLLPTRAVNPVPIAQQALGVKCASLGPRHPSTPHRVACPYEEIGTTWTSLEVMQEKSDGGEPCLDQC